MLYMGEKEARKLGKLGTASQTKRFYVNEKVAKHLSVNMGINLSCLPYRKSK